jgi:hypothetical protein
MWSSAAVFFSLLTQPSLSIPFPAAAAVPLMMLVNSHELVKAAKTVYMHWYGSWVMGGIGTNRARRPKPSVDA